MSDRVNVLFAHAAASPWTQTVLGALSALPVDFRAVHSDNEAIGLLTQNAMHAAIFCENLPGGGLTALRRVRTLGLRLPCLLLSADTSDRVLREALELDVFSVIHAENCPQLLPPVFLRMVKRAYQLSGPAWSRPE